MREVCFYHCGGDGGADCYGIEGHGIFVVVLLPRRVAVSKQRRSGLTRAEILKYVALWCWVLIENDTLNIRLTQIQRRVVFHCNEACLEWKFTDR